MKQIFLLLAIGISSIAWAGKVYTVETVPKLRVYNKEYVSDPDRLLKPETVKQLNERLAALEALTTDQVAVVVLNAIGNVSANDFARGLYLRFRMGQKEKDNGLLILLVMKNNQVGFETGYGMEGVLPDASCLTIQQDYMMPRFEEGNYDQGLLDGVSEIIKILDDPRAAQRTEQEASKPADIGRVVAWLMAVPYLLFISVFYFVKKSRGSFAEDYEKLSEAKKKNINLVIPRWRWLLLYIFNPLLFYCLMIYSYHGPYYLLVLFAGVYGLILLVLLDKKQRSKEAYAASYKEGDYFDQYNNFNRYFDNWGIAAVFFPIPFLFTDARNNHKLNAIRRHERSCAQCHTPMILLDEKKDDEYLMKSQIMEESIKSIDYDVWLCPACHSHYALGYNSKFSKYKACSYCGTKASFLESDITKIAASYEGSGSGERTYKCMYCKKVSTEEYSIPQLIHGAGHGTLQGPDSGKV